MWHKEVIKKTALNLPESCRSSWLQATDPSLHGRVLDQCNTPACSLQQLPTPDGSQSLEHHCMGEPGSKAQTNELKQGHTNTGQFKTDQ